MAKIEYRGGQPMVSSKRWCGWVRDLQGPLPWRWQREGETVRASEDYCLTALNRMYPDSTDIGQCRWCKVAIPVPQTPTGKLEL